MSEENVTEEPEFEIDITDDKGWLEKEEYSWDELTLLKDEIGTKLIEFTLEVNNILEDERIIPNLGDRREEFMMSINLFLKDVNNFSLKIKETREKHEGRTGKVLDLDEFDEYNRITMTYHGLYNELINIIAPSMTSIMLVIADTVDNHLQPEQEVTENE